MPSPSETNTIGLLEQNGVRAVACTFVDNAGVNRVKTVPVERLASAVDSGIGISYVFAVFGVNDHITACPGFDTPSGDMRLVPDLDAAVALAHSSGWAWAPVWQLDQEKRPMPICQRTFLADSVRRAADNGITFQMTYEVEFTLLDDADRPLNAGLPSYSPRKLLPVEDFTVDLLDALADQGIQVVQFHPEYSDGQYELSVAPRSPMAAADQYVLLRNTVCRIARRHEFKASFAPVVVPGAVGNGTHLHFSAWKNGANLFTGGGGPEGLTAAGESLAAGVLAHLGDMTVVFASSVPSYARLQPSHWSGAYTCWGWENREAALRLCKGTANIRDRSANFEIKTIDGTANPYLVCGLVIAAALDGLNAERTLPPGIQDDPHKMSPAQREQAGIVRLPGSLAEATDRMAASTFLQTALPRSLFDAFIAVKRLDWETYGQKDPDETAVALRWCFG